jgi:putative ABC transport system permease protein
MLHNYLKAALRNLMRNKLVSMINIAGLAVGFAAAIMIGLYLRYQLSYETFLPGHERVYRLSLTITRPGTTPDIQDGADFLMAERLKLDYPEVEMSARITGDFPSVRRGNIEFQENVFSADADFFRIMPFPTLAGDLSTALDSPDGLVITRAIARKYFGDEDPIGQTLELNRNETLRVLAVIEDLPGNTHFNFRMVASGRAKFSALRSIDSLRDRPDVFVPNLETFFRLRDGITPARIEADGANFLKRHYQRQLGTSAQLDIYPLARVHLRPPGRWPVPTNVNPRTLQSLGLVGVLVILIAAINFVNLMTARAAQRAIEVGVRKSAGARRGQLIAQFLGEAFVYVFAATLVAMALVELALPAFNAMLSVNDEMYQPATVTFQYWREPTLAGALLLGAILTGLLAGAYPAFVMSAMSPANALHQNFTASGTSRVREWLVVTQLAILIALLVATAVIHRQTTFATKESLRISAEQVLLVFASEQTPSEAFKDALAHIPGVSGVTAATALPTNYDGNAALFSHRPGTEPVLLQFSAIDANFFEFYRLQPLAGRLPSRDRGTDLFVMNDADRHLSLWINETAVRALGITSPAAAIGQQLKPSWPPNFTPPASITIAGVMPDFPVDSVRGPIQPVAFFVQPGFARIVSVRLRGEEIPETLAAIDEVWKRLGEPRPISTLFLDHYYQRMYTDVIQQRSVLGSLCAVAVFLACLGLFGLSIYTAQRRTREIGIRKVMGAATSDIMRLLLWAFSKPVFWGSILAWPIAAWVMSRWLDGFTYRINFNWWLLPLASLLALGIALATVSVHSYLVARTRPASSLRYQ